MTSYRRGPSARRTGRSYSDPETVPRRRLGPQRERPEAHRCARCGGRRAGHPVPRRREDEADRRPVAHGGGQAGARTSAGAKDEQVDPADAVLPETGEDRRLVGVAGELQDDLAIGTSPEPAADGDLHAVEPDRGRTGGGDDAHGGHDRSDGRDDGDPTSAGLATEPGDRPRAGPHHHGDHHDDCRERPGVERRERQGGRGPGDAADPREEQAGRDVQGGSDGTAEDAGRETGGDAPRPSRGRRQGRRAGWPATTPRARRRTPGGGRAPPPAARRG